MASMQQVAIPEKHLKKISELKAALAADKTCMVDDLKPMPKLMLPLGKAPCLQDKKQTTHTRGLIVNLTQCEAAAHVNKDWSGRVIGGYRPIQKEKDSGFHHKGTSDDPDGSKGAVVYAGKARDNKDVAFLLAWYSGPYIESTNKVYVECGNLDDYKKVNWEHIEKLLDATTESKGHYRHENTGAKLSAEIDPIGINPKLACVFDVVN